MGLHIPSVEDKATANSPLPAADPQCSYHVIHMAQGDRLGWRCETVKWMIDTGGHLCL